MLKLTQVYSDVFSPLHLPGSGGIVEQWLNADVGRTFCGWVNVCDGGSLIFSSRSCKLEEDEVNLQDMCATLADFLHFLALL